MVALFDTSLAHNYIYPHTKTLKNKYGIMDHKKLEKRCKRDAKKIVDSLRDEPLPEKFDSSYLKYLHKRLFESAFEWAGYTRDLSFAFDDGTIAQMVMMKLPETDIYFAHGDKIQENLKKFDEMLASKNNLQGLSREDFIEEAVKLFSFLNYIHPFRAGNEPIQRIFFEKLAEGAGHNLDFSVATEKRIMRACSDAMTLSSDIAHKTMKCLFEDISDSEKVLILKDFFDRIPKVELQRLNNEYVIMPQEGITYTGTYQVGATNSIMFKTADSHILCLKEYFKPEQLKTLKPGGELTFTVPMKKNLDQILIPGEKLAPLKEEEIIKWTRKADCVQKHQREIDRCLELIYQNRMVLDEHMTCIHKYPETGIQLAEQIRKSPHSISKLAGFKIWFIKSPRRRMAENNILELTQKIEKHVQIVKSVKDKIFIEHKKEQKRVEHVVKKPSKEIQEVLNLPKDEQKKVLESSPSLYKDLCSFLDEVNSRLSVSEQEYVSNKQDMKFSCSVGVSENQAKMIIDIVNKSVKLHNQIKAIKTDRSQVMAMAV
ncbi:BID domain-containing T4SS effector [Bartonella bilalgolemii]|uniref:protein adenylyltransferase n=1 Tax=Bartonella bilalgolemii TaxID=2942911 RepID=A0ABT0PBV7_9HYPH|nr:BID domain-containing T4SS effector [Bartonella sp. G70]MCL6230318.1 BID domain-containing T4SS effector [Bartonella sp. G70]